MTVQQIEAFKRENDLSADGDGESAAVGADFDDEIDLRAEDDALIAAELEAAELEVEREREEAERRAAEERAESNGDDAEDDDAEEAGTRARPRRRRGGRARRVLRRTRNLGPLEGTFDHGEEGYGLWLDPGIQDDATYAEHWAGHRPVTVTVERDRIVIRRAGGGEDDD